MKDWCKPDGVSATVEDVISSITRKGCEVFVGTDSHLLGGKWVIATVVVSYMPGAGGAFFFSRSFHPKQKFPDIARRLLFEVSESVDVATWVQQISGITPIVHADLNRDESNKSAKVLSSAISYVRGMGFECVTKPDAWASTSIADKKAR
jgi:predicted RNase H-related nuclease YkuK (DUF458 family)